MSDSNVRQKPPPRRPPAKSTPRRPDEAATATGTLMGGFQRAPPLPRVTALASSEPSREELEQLLTSGEPAPDLDTIVLARTSAPPPPVEGGSPGVEAASSAGAVVPE